MYSIFGVRNSFEMSLGVIHVSVQSGQYTGNMVCCVLCGQAPLFAWRHIIEAVLLPFSPPVTLSRFPACTGGGPGRRFSGQSDCTALMLFVCVLTCLAAKLMNVNVNPVSL